MSRRFGRNQRRRAREEIAALQDQLAKQARRLEDAHLQLLAAESFARDVAEIVGREAVLAGEPVTLDYRFNREEARDPFQREPYKPIDWRRCIEHTTIETVRYETMHLLNLDSVADLCRAQMHVYVTLEDGTVGYAISASALRRMPRAQLVNQIATYLARGLTDKLRSKE